VQRQSMRALASIYPGVYSWFTGGATPAYRYSLSSESTAPLIRGQPNCEACSQPRALDARRNLKRLRLANPAVVGRMDKHVRWAHCHHQKSIVVDGHTAFVGGLDMTDHDIDRWDTTAHPFRDGFNWHDICLQIEGEAAADVAQNFAQRWQAVSHETIRPVEVPPNPPGQGVPVQVVRTIAAENYSFAPQGEFGIAWAYRRAISKAKRFIYIENQYL
jgi:phosphatidylserine/phosphatidylglycerophosphate/cardiolipin synthase-like enzyme